ncbi:MULTISPECIES: hypothetical protein [unclassified Thioalkalivibrio]|uniref:hypothetical protein n=1 Tax=unclassified Thioalkalivibrio TaxID=2621013 RepID=UPI0003600AA4|nr:MULTISPECIES: hypothetical protein [unclassified Thioalkalivibrio]
MDLVRQSIQHLAAGGTVRAIISEYSSMMHFESGPDEPWSKPDDEGLMADLLSAIVLSQSDLDLNGIDASREQLEVTLRLDPESVREDAESPPRFEVAFSHQANPEPRRESSGWVEQDPEVGAIARELVSLVRAEMRLPEAAAGEQFRVRLFPGNPSQGNTVQILSPGERAYTYSEPVDIYTMDSFTPEIRDRVATVIPERLSAGYKIADDVKGRQRVESPEGGCQTPEGCYSYEKIQIGGDTLRAGHVLVSVDYSVRDPGPLVSESDPDEPPSKLDINRVESIFTERSTLDGGEHPFIAHFKQDWARRLMNVQVPAQTNQVRSRPRL